MNSSKARLAVVVYDSLEALGRIRLGFNPSLGYLCVLLAFSISLLGSGADLTITQSHAGGFLPGETQTSYTVSVMNAGTGPTTGMVSVSDSVPPTLTPASIAGQGWTCVQPSGPCTRMDVLYPRTRFPDLTLSVAVAPDAPTTVANTVTVSQDGKTMSSTSDPTTITAASAGAPVSDDFTAATLNTDIWTFANPQNDGTFALNGSSLLLSVPAGKSHDVWTNGYYGVRLMQAIADADFDVEVKFGSAVSIQSPYQQQGLLVEQDPANFLRFSIYSDEQRTFLFCSQHSGRLCHCSGVSGNSGWWSHLHACQPDRDGLEVQLLVRLFALDARFPVFRGASCCDDRSLCRQWAAQWRASTRFYCRRRSFCQSAIPTTHRGRASLPS